MIQIFFLLFDKETGRRKFRGGQKHFEFEMSSHSSHITGAWHHIQLSSAEMGFANSSSGWPGTVVQACRGTKRDHSSKITQAKVTVGVAEAAEHLLSKHKALSANPVPPKKINF